MVAMRAWAYLSWQSFKPVRQWLEKKEDIQLCDQNKEMVRMNQMSKEVLKDRR